LKLTESYFYSVQVLTSTWVVLNSFKPIISFP
jgi:hypothetical protein